MYTSSYDKKNAQDILRHAKQMKGICLRKYLSHTDDAKLIDSIIDLETNKGGLGNIIEEYLFKKKPDNNPEPDFPEAGVELKVTPLKTLQNGDLVIKERLVLTMINFDDIVKEKWSSNTLMKKLKLILLMFYIHEKDTPSINLIFNLIDLWSPSELDLKIIEDDWNFIVNKIREGKAHELSEGDTSYLGACPKGANKLDTRTQPFNKIMAMRRAFSLKTSYMRTVLEELRHKQSKLVKISKSGHYKEETLNTFKPYIGKSLEYIMNNNNIKRERNEKNFNKNVINDFLKQTLGGSSAELEEFQKANITLKTIVLKKNEVPKESMSFKQIKYKEIITEKWEDFEINKIHNDGRFLWVIFKINKSFSNQSSLDLSDIILHKVMFWNMPYNDLQVEYKKLWLDTKRKVRKGDYSNFMGAKDNPVGHVRTKGQGRGKDLMDTPQGGKETRKAFWINADYIAEQIKKNS